jgi:Transposase DDE domain group 1
MRSYANFTYQAGSWTKPRLVVAEVEGHPGELYPRVGVRMTNMARPAENVVAFYNKRGTCEQWIKEGNGAIKWPRLSCLQYGLVHVPSHPRRFDRSSVSNTYDPYRDVRLVSPIACFGYDGRNDPWARPLPADRVPYMIARPRLTPEQRREKVRLRSERWRRAHGIGPRKPAQRPWLALGISRSTL